jgi:hypothetical protein
MQRGSSADLCVNGLHPHMARLSYVQCRRMSSDLNSTSLMVGCSQREERFVQHLLSRQACGLRRGRRGGYQGERADEFRAVQIGRAVTYYAMRKLNGYLVV